MAALATASWLGCDKHERVEGLSGPVAIVSSPNGEPVRLRQAPTRGFLGIVFDPHRALTVERVAPGTSAAEGGVRPGDVIGALDGHVVANATELAAMLERKAPGDIVELRFVRDGQPLSASITLTTYADFTTRLRAATP